MIGDFAVAAVKKHSAVFANSQSLELAVHAKAVAAAGAIALVAEEVTLGVAVAADSLQHSQPGRCSSDDSVLARKKLSLALDHVAPEDRIAR